MRQPRVLHGLVTTVALLSAMTSALWPGSASNPTGASPAARAEAICWPAELPLGALPPAKPVWCTPLTDGKNTFVIGENSWLDEFDHGLSNAEFVSDAYTLAQTGGDTLLGAAYFLHADHWMVDVAGTDQTPQDGPWNLGGTMMRPSRSFRFQDGKLVVEADVAAGIAEYGGAVWPELVVTTAPAPTGNRRDGIYNYDRFPGHWTVGCRLQSERAPICAMFDDTTRGPGEGGRVFEISHFQHEGAQQVSGGGPYTAELDKAWRVCRNTDPDLHCRDRFRWELTRDSLTIYVNGVKYMEHKGLPVGKHLPDALLNAEVYVYFGSWIFKPAAETVRFHWDRIAINPESGPSAAPAGGQAHSHPGATEAPVAHSHPGATEAPVGSPGGHQHGAAPSQAPGEGNVDPAAANTITFDDEAGENRGLSGQAHSGVIDWGSGQWYLSGPWGAFSTKSVSFDGRNNPGRTSAAFTFVSPRRLVSLRAYNGGGAPSTVTLSCPGQPTTTATVTPGQLTIIHTGWTEPCAEVHLGSSNGWDTNFDDLSIE